MAAKVVYTEDKQGLEKQLGCMNGIFHLLDRGYLLGQHRHSRSRNRPTRVQDEKELKRSSAKGKEKNRKKMAEKNLTSVDCSERVRTEWQCVPCAPTSPNVVKQPDRSTDIRDVVKDSMTRVIHVAKHERAGPVMKHVDSPRPVIHQNSIQYQRQDPKVPNLAKIQKVASRYSCDEKESRYSLKSTLKINELPRFSLDSKRNSKTNSLDESKSEPGSNKKPSSRIVARLMGLDSLTDSICEVKILKIKPESQPFLQQKDGGDPGSKKPSLYGAFEFQSSRDDLRALKQILEAMQMTKRSLDTQKYDQSGPSIVKDATSSKRHELLDRAVKPATQPIMVMGRRYINHKARKQVRDPTPKTNKATEDRLVSSPRPQRSTNGTEKQCFNGPSPGSTRIKNQSKFKTRGPKIKPVRTVQDADKANSLRSESKQVSCVNENKFAERLIKDKPTVEAKLTMEQASPVSVLDGFYVEDMPSPVKKKPNPFDDHESLCIDETGWNQVGMYNLVTGTDAGEFHQIELLNSSDGETEKSSGKSTSWDHKYIREILSASGFLKDPDSAIRIAQLHPTGSLIKPELFHILEKTSDERHKKNTGSIPNEKVRRKLIFDSVNEILFRKLAVPGFYGKRRGRSVDGEKLQTELWLEIDNLQSISDRCICDEDVKILVNADVDKNSQDWDGYCCEVSGLVQDIERLIFKDLIDEAVNPCKTRIE